MASIIRSGSALPVLLVGIVFSQFAEIRDQVKANLRRTGAVAIMESSECVIGAGRLALELASTAKP